MSSESIGQYHILGILIFIQFSCFICSVELIQVFADSGGSKVDWVFYSAQGERVELQTESYHPRYLNPEKKIEIKQFWSKYTITNCTLRFFGAGCFREEANLEMTKFFREIGFGAVYVESDVLGAAIALFQENDGFGAISGTGSVLFDYKNGAIQKLIGGLGKPFGDPGSGMYFGNLVVDQYLEAKLPDDVNAFLQEILGDRSALSELNQLERNKYAKQLAKELASFKTNSAVKALHIVNIEAFFNQLKGIKVDKMSFVGSYAHHYKEFFKQVASDNGIEVTIFLKSPIQGITDYFKNTTL